MIHHSIPEATVDFAVAAPGVIIASDAGDYEEDGNGHPRSAGTFARVLGRHVREKKALTLMEALAKMTILPARRLERASPSMKNKGRIESVPTRIVTVFDPAGHRSRHLRASGFALRGHLVRAREWDARGAGRKARARSLSRARNPGRAAVTCGE